VLVLPHAQSLYHQENALLVGGDGKIDKPINCTHGRNVSHSYCNHNKISQHDN